MNNRTRNRIKAIGMIAHVSSISEKDKVFLTLLLNSQVNPDIVAITSTIQKEGITSDK